MSKLFNIMPLDSIVPPKAKANPTPVIVVSTSKQAEYTSPATEEDLFNQAFRACKEIKTAELEDAIGRPALRIPLEDYLKTVGNSYDVLVAQALYALFTTNERPKAAYENNAVQDRLTAALSASKLHKPKPAAAVAAR